MKKPNNIVCAYCGERMTHVNSKAKEHMHNGCRSLKALGIKFDKDKRKIVYPCATPKNY